ncbi:MAG TPA: type II secretion system protein [Candidatus Saccharimonadales bacterium]
MRTYTKKLTKGFTIIEVLIVLAIAGLILAIVFLAVPALQRNSRNNSRINDAAHLAGLVNDYLANHGGVLPTGVLPGSPPGDLDITTENWAIMATPVDGNFVALATFGTTGTMNVNLGFTCNSATNTLTAQPRAFAISYQVETSGAAQNRCIQG